MAQQTSRTAEELDEEFKNILKKIHPYFKTLKSSSKGIYEIFLNFVTFFQLM